MRGQLTIDNAIVREIRPIDVTQAIDRLLFNYKDSETVTNDQWSAALFAGSDLIEGGITDEVNAAFAFVNRAYLQKEFPDSRKSTATPSTLSIKKLNRLQSALLKECAVLQHHGHTACWNYGWAFFTSVQSIYQEK